MTFYLLTVFQEPGYVPRHDNFLDLLEKLVMENFHLDYVCVYCENLRPENSNHCNFCDRCVQKFDHHCVFINNCLGYRNHKWFILMLISFSGWLLFLLIHSSYAIISALIFDKRPDSIDSIFWLQISINSYLILVVILHLPVVVMQVRL